MHTLRKSTVISASHRLGSLGEGHQCTNVHGHSYRIDIVIAATTSFVSGNKHGWVLDFGEISSTLRTLDHRDLNEALYSDSPTAESMSEWIWSELCGIMNADLNSRCTRSTEDKFWVGVTVHEGPGASVTYCPDGLPLGMDPYCGPWSPI